jgi:hypothetical protein
MPSMAQIKLMLLQRAKELKLGEFAQVDHHELGVPLNMMEAALEGLRRDGCFARAPRPVGQELVAALTDRGWNELERLSR